MARPRSCESDATISPTPQPVLVPVPPAHLYLGLLLCLSRGQRNENGFLTALAGGS